MVVSADDDDADDAATTRVDLDKLILGRNYVVHLDAGVDAAGRPGVCVCWRERKRATNCARIFVDDRRGIELHQPTIFQSLRSTLTTIIQRRVARASLL